MKIFKRIALCLCLIFSASILWACGKEDAKITEIYFKDGSVVLEVEQFSDYSTSGIKVIAKLDDGTETELTGVTFENISTNSTGEKTLKAKYKDFTCEIKINVTPFTGARPYYITAIKSPEFIAQFEAKSSTANTYTNQIAADAADKTKGFVRTGDIYKVGNDNPFKFSPSISVEYFDVNKDPEDIHNFPIAADVYQHNGTSYVLLTPEQIDDVVDINKNEHTFDFEEVTGKFKIEVRPDFDVIIGEDEYTSDGSEALNGNEFKAISFEFEVVDGYNVYNAKDLSVVDNCNDEGKWTAYKGALKDVTTNGVILHGDITITTADIPSVHIYSDSNKGDYEGEDYNKVKGFMVNEDGYYNQAIIYKRVIPGNGKFTMEGNYYTISADELPLVKNPEWGVDNIAVVCTALFGFIDDYTDPTNHSAGRDAVNKGITEDTTPETCQINNVAFMGNSNKSEMVGAAGLCCYKTENVDFTMDNCLSQAWYISHFLEGSSRSGDEVVHTLKNCTAFDSYNTLLYSQGARTIVIEDSYFIGAGGPVMICDEEVDQYDLNGDGDDSDEEDKMHFPTNVTVEDSVLQSYIVGTEAWFISANASEIVGSFKAMNALLMAKGNSIVSKNTDNVDSINLIAVYKDSDTAGIGQCDINASFKDISKDAELNNKFALGLELSSDPEKKDPIDTIRETFTNQVSQQIIAANPGKDFETEIKPLIAETLGKMAILQDFAGEIKVPGNEGYLQEVTKGSGFTPGYLNVHLFNGMAAVVGLK